MEWGVGACNKCKMSLVLNSTLNIFFYEFVDVAKYVFLFFRSYSSIHMELVLDDRYTRRRGKLDILPKFVIKSL